MTVHVLRFCYRAKTHPKDIFGKKNDTKNNLKETGIKYGTSIFFYSSSQKNTRLQYNKIKFKRLEQYFLPIFKLQRRVPSGSRSRKMLQLCHRHGSAPRSPSMPCQILDQWKSFELYLAEIRNIGDQKTEVEVLPSIKFSLLQAGIYLYNRPK